MNTRFLIATGLVFCLNAATDAATVSSSAFVPCDAAREIVLIPSGLPVSSAAAPISLTGFSKSNPKVVFTARYDALYTGAGMGVQGWDLLESGSKRSVGTLLRKSNQAYDNGLDSSFNVKLPSKSVLECRWFAGQIASLVTNNRSIYIVAQNANGDVREAKTWDDLKLSYRSFDFKAAPTDRVSTGVSGGKHTRLTDGSDQFSFFNKKYEYRVTISKTGFSSVSVLLSEKLLSKSNALAQSYSLPFRLQ
jgi:hypothetical protein